MITSNIDVLGFCRRAGSDAPYLKSLRHGGTGTWFVQGEDVGLMAVTGSSGVGVGAGEGGAVEAVEFSVEMRQMKGCWVKIV